jgi:hypothetical protein
VRLRAEFHGAEIQRPPARRPSSPSRVAACESPLGKAMASGQTKPCNSYTHRETGKEGVAHSTHRSATRAFSGSRKSFSAAPRFHPRSDRLRMMWSGRARAPRAAASPAQRASRLRSKENAETLSCFGGLVLRRCWRKCDESPPLFTAEAYRGRRGDGRDGSRN